MAKQGTQPQAMDQRPDGASAEGLANTPASSGASGRFELDTARLLRAISDCHAASLGIAQALASRGAGSASTQRSQRASLSGGPVRLTNAALDALDEGVVLVGADARVALVNSAACDLLGLEAVVARAALIDAPMRELFRQLHPVDTDGGGHDFGSFLKCPGGQHDGYMVRLAGQRDYGVSLEVRALGEEGWLLVLRRDDGARDDEQRLRVAEQEYQSLFENAVIGIYRSSFDGRQLRANPALVRLNGYDSEEELLRSVNDIAAEWYVDPGRREAFKRELDTHGRVTDFVSEIYRHKTRERIWISENAWVVRDPAGTPLFYEGTVVDASDRMAAEEEINHLAHHDHLTGLPNRFMLLKKLREALLQPQTASTVAVLCLDLDHFKDVNDTLGHQAGDRLLVSVGKRLRRSIKAGDVLARLGGDEFTVLQAGVRSERDTEALARRIVQALSEPFMIGETEVSIGVSVGIAGFAGQEPADLLRDADVALYEAKRGGRGRFAHYTDAMGEALRDR
ncbi:MAG: sensor domain-containing diguanylate cyclase, partial [Devosiaceae bacterium]|nr:sensor domain-containing diguanylate cyclase [Devosiaceae bacterium MH13]